MIRIPLAAAAVLVLFAADASAKDCKGTFVRRSCMTAGGQGQCSYPKEKGTREEFMGWEMDDGVRAYSVYRLGAYPAKDIQLDPGCRLPKYM